MYYLLDTQRHNTLVSAVTAMDQTGEFVSESSMCSNKGGVSVTLN